MSELLVARQGPLAHVWLASNYDKKLSKAQFLNTNIVASSSLLSHRQIEPSSGNENNFGDTITLRLSGQLLLGIVRIYSRKTKYLLEDINEVLHKLKTSFQYASGASLGSASVVSNNINLPPQQTTVSNLSRITLQDQISGHDLFFQEDLVLDDASDRIAEAMAQFQQGTVGSQQNPEENVNEFDKSVEIARNANTDNADADADADVDVDLDLDFNLDNSIEIGRDAQAALPDAEQSLISIGDKEQEIDASGLPDVDFDLDLPIGDSSVIAASDDSDAPHEVVTSLQQRGTVEISDVAISCTTKRKLVVDSFEDLERGIPNEVLRNIQAWQNNGRLSGESITIRLSSQEKLDLINELAQPLYQKRRKLTDLDQQLRQRCLELSAEEDTSFSEDALADQSQDLDLDMDMNMNMNLDIDANLDFDLSLVEVDADKGREQVPDQVKDHEENSEYTGPENLRSTAQVAEHLRNFFFDKPAVTLDELVTRDSAAIETSPLGLTHKSNTSMKISDRREATKCFFELLVLATQDCVSLEQEEPVRGTQIQKNLRVRPRDLLVSNFL